MNALKKMLTCSLLLVLVTSIQAQTTNNGNTVVSEEGAWCWFADPRALHYENATGSINATYIGYIDVRKKDRCVGT